MSRTAERSGTATPAGGAGSPPPGRPGGAGLDRILARETTSSRAAASVIAAVLVIGLCGYALLETAVRAVGQPPWLIDPQTAAERITALPAGVPPLLLGAAGAVVFVAGLFFFLNAVLPGRRARHVLANPRAAVVVDDEVIASALARRARLAANVTQEQVMVVVSRREVQVNVRPTSGVPLQAADIQAAVEDELRDMAPSPLPVVRVNLASAGVIGA
ncbi:DUF6286 domain-containing protein [Arthrobacter sp. Soil763]|uniref:DUF6286 domain-containing protein n=1 Tax=Arthrobacter sp. Soil763 TaxID=1736402 RepID=UPI0006FCC5F7|nr:DUF6286 domain-containing protein [Arthrobacter sp. Soil763]KRE81717.1 hypothetical protein ASG71_01180 [Arthrobacter sp. Soil763]